MIAGRPLLDLLLIYPAQAGQYEQLTMHAPSALSWIPDSGRFYRLFLSGRADPGRGGGDCPGLAIYLSPRASRARCCWNWR